MQVIFTLNVLVILVCPYLAYSAIISLKREGLLKSDLSEEQCVYNYVKGNNDGIKKVMSKMGISTLQSYKGKL